MSIRIGLDVDGVLANFSEAFIQRGRAMGYGHLLPCCWLHNKHWGHQLDAHPKVFSAIWSSLATDPEFWLALPVMPMSHGPLPFKPVLYCTSRRIPGVVTMSWLSTNGFPAAPVYTVSRPEDKVDSIKGHCDLFIDDKADTVRQLNAAGIPCVLFAAPHHCGEDVSGLVTIESLHQLHGTHLDHILADLGVGVAAKSAPAVE